MAIVIPKMLHRCVVKDGLMAGNYNHHMVSGYELEFGMDCEICGKKLATPEQAIAHIYAQLIEGD